MLEVLLILSVIKSALIIGYFMHLKFERALMRWMLMALGRCLLHHHVFLFLPRCGQDHQTGSEVRILRHSGSTAILLAMALWSAPALAQGCAMCRANAKATPKDGQRAINRAILVMLVAPLGIATFGTRFVVRYVRRRDRENEES